MNLKKKKDKAAKKREYQKEYMRERRAKQKREKLVANKPPESGVASRMVTRKTTSFEMPSSFEGLPRLEDVHRVGYQAGVNAILKVAKAIEGIKPEHLSTLEIKRLNDIGHKLLATCSGSIGEVTEEDQFVMTAEVVSSDDNVAHVHALLKSSVEDQSILSLESDLEGSEHCEDDTG